MDLLDWFGDISGGIEAAAVGLGASPWLILIVFGCCCVDAVFPVVPSDSMVTAATVLALASGVPGGFIIVLVVAAALGALLGDCLAYCIGAKVPLQRLPGLGGRRAQAGFEFAKRVFLKRGSLFIVTGRFIPVGRIAVNISAGATGYPLRRFFPIAAFAGSLWVSVAAVMGILARHVLQENTFLAVLLGISFGVVFGVVIDWLIQRRERRLRIETSSAERT